MLLPEVTGKVTYYGAFEVVSCLILKKMKHRLMHKMYKDPNINLR